MKYRAAESVTTTHDATRPEEALMEPNIGQGSGDGQLDVASAEAGFTALFEIWEIAVEELGCSVPAAQVRALLIVDQAGALNLDRLATALGGSASATSRLCDRMEAAGLLTKERAAAGRREIRLLVTGSGRRLAGWVRGRRRAVMAQVLRSMSPDGREALARGLREVAAGF
jgi:DNA-binding MarR family transcriptional regulator